MSPQQTYSHRKPNNLVRSQRRGRQEPRRPSRWGEKLHEGFMQVDAGVRAAANTVTFGGADKFAAAVDALGQRGGMSDFGRRYRKNMAFQKARNEYDARYRRRATQVGQTGGTILGLATTQRLAMPLKAVRRAGAAKLSGREVAALLGVGGVAGAGTQRTANIVAGRNSTLADLAGAAAGGVAGAAALVRGPGAAGAAEGWVTSAAQDVFNGRRVSLERAGQGAIAGSAIGGAFGRVAGRASARLSSRKKGRLGEALGSARSTLNGRRRILEPKTLEYVPAANGKDLGWYPDGRSGRYRFEDKFGYSATLSHGQRAARAALGKHFILSHFLPDDIARLAGGGGVFIVPNGGGDEGDMP